MFVLPLKLLNILNLLCARLRDGGKTEVCKEKWWNQQTTKRTLSADQVIGEIIDGKNSFILIAVGPNGDFGTLFEWFLHSSNPLPLPSFSFCLLSLKFRWQQIICSRSNLTFVGRREEDQPYGWSSLMLLLFVEKQVGPCRGQCGRRSEDMEWGEEWWWWRSIDRRQRATGKDSEQQVTNKKKRCKWEGIGSDLEQRAEVTARTPGGKERGERLWKR